MEQLSSGLVGLVVGAVLGLALSVFFAVRREVLATAGLQAHWNGPTYAVAGLSIRRLGIDESPGVHLRLKSTDYRLELLAFDIDRRTNQWGCVFVAFLHEITGSQLAERRTRGVADKWEHDQTEFVRFTVPHVVNHLLRPDRRNDWTPVAPAAFHLALVRRFGRAYVERLTAQVLRKRADS